MSTCERKRRRHRWKKEKTLRYFEDKAKTIGINVRRPKRLVSSIESEYTGSASRSIRYRHIADSLQSIRSDTTEKFNVRHVHK